MREIACHDQGTGERQPGLDRMLGELRQTSLSAGESMWTTSPPSGGIDVGQVLRRIASSLLEIDAVA
jgi:hypothetical protein